MEDAIQKSTLFTTLNLGTRSQTNLNRGKSASNLMRGSASCVDLIGERQNLATGEASGQVDQQSV